MNAQLFEEYENGYKCDQYFQKKYFIKTLNTFSDFKNPVTNLIA